MIDKESPKISNIDSSLFCDRQVFNVGNTGDFRISAFSAEELKVNGHCIGCRLCADKI